MSRSKNSRKGSKYGKWNKEFWSKRGDGIATGYSGPDAKKMTAKKERQLNKPKDSDFE